MFFPTVDQYTINNIINAALTVFIIIACTIWLARFAASLIKHRDRVGVFLVSIASLLFIGNAFRLIVQIGQALGMTNYRVMFSGAATWERVLSAIIVIIMFYAGSDRAKKYYE
jgi:hypothetical protein